MRRRSITLSIPASTLVRSWAEPWSGDPLPGTYYLRISAIAMPEQDLGLTTGIDLLVSVEDSGDPAPEGGKLTAPLVPAAKPGTVLSGAKATASAPEAATDWLPDASSRWAWTAAGGVLAAVAAVGGFALVRRPRWPAGRGVA